MGRLGGCVRQDGFSTRGQPGDDHRGQVMVRGDGCREEPVHPAEATDVDGTIRGAGAGIGIKLVALQAVSHCEILEGPLPWIKFGQAKIGREP